MLGTGGGPRPRPDRAATSHALIVDDVLYALDCGHPVAAAAGVKTLVLSHLVPADDPTVTEQTVARRRAAPRRRGDRRRPRPDATVRRR